MRFSLILYGFYWLIKYTILRHRSFSRYMSDLDLAMVMRTEDGIRARLYHFKNGEITSRRKNYSNPDFSLIWKNAQIGYRYLSRKRKLRAITKALTQKDLRIEGDAQKVTRYLQVLKQLFSYYRGRKKTTVN